MLLLCLCFCGVSFVFCSCILCCVLFVFCCLYCVSFVLFLSCFLYSVLFVWRCFVLCVVVLCCFQVRDVKIHCFLNWLYVFLHTIPTPYSVLITWYHHDNIGPRYCLGEVCMVWIDFGVGRILFFVLRKHIVVLLLSRLFLLLLWLVLLLLSRLLCRI